MFYITGDTHRDFGNVAAFCKRMNTTKEDVMIVLGDAGINFHGGFLDRLKKQELERYPITFFCIHGNHEKRPSGIPDYHIQDWNGGKVYVEDEYPSLLFAIDGEVYDLGGQRSIVIGGAYSLDKPYRLAHGWPWWPDEQPSDEIKQRVEARLAEEGWKIDVVLSHTCPLKYEPVEVFLPQIDQSTVDKSTEEWLDAIEDRLEYQKWFCGHYHTEKVVDKLIMMYQSIREFSSEVQENG